MTDNFPRRITNLFKYDELKNLPELEWKNQYMGDTDYIDRIEEDEVKHSIMKGVDRFNRNFITFKIKFNDKITIHTLFQRYTDSYGLWVIGTCYNLFFNVVPTTEDLERLKRLINGESLSDDKYAEIVLI